MSYLTDPLLQLSPLEALRTASMMYAAHGVVIEPSGLVRRVEFETKPVSSAPQTRFGPLWVRVDVVLSNTHAMTEAMMAEIQRTRR